MMRPSSKILMIFIMGFSFCLGSFSYGHVDVLNPPSRNLICNNQLVEEGICPKSSTQLDNSLNLSLCVQLTTLFSYSDASQHLGTNATRPPTRVGENCAPELAIC